MIRVRQRTTLVLDRLMGKPRGPEATYLQKEEARNWVRR